VCLIWGTTYLGIRISLETMPPMLMAGLRWTIAGGLLALAATRLWPTWERTHINESLAHLLDAYRDSFQTVRDGYLHPGIERDPDYAARLDRVRQASRLARNHGQRDIATADNLAN